MAGVIKTVVFIFAMWAEASPFVAKLGLKQDKPPKFPAPAPAVTYSGQYGGLNVHVVWSGRDTRYKVDLVGTEPATLSTWLACQYLKPDLLVNAGTAGGFRAKGAAIGDIFVANSTQYHDHRVPLPGSDKLGRSYERTAPTPKLQRALGLKSGLVSTGDSLDYTPADMAFMVRTGAAVKEMEAAAIAWVARLFKKPVVYIKSITDIVDGGKPTNEEFTANLDAAAASLQRTLPKVLSFMAGKTVAQL